MSERYEVILEQLAKAHASDFVEVGVWKAELTKFLLINYSHFHRYYAVDPWRHLENWNKPFNVSQEEFDNIYNQVSGMAQYPYSPFTVVRSTTLSLAEENRKFNVDFVYIDGDHTALGIITDLLYWYDQLQPGGFIMGDDYIDLDSKFQHSDEFDKTMVKPVVQVFCKINNLKLVELPCSQFIFRKPL